MSQSSFRVAALVPLLVLAAGAARADIPDIPDSALEAACAAAKDVDGCPACSCQMITSTMAHKQAATSAVPLGVVLQVAGTTPDGNEYKAIHAAIGTREALDHVGRLAENRGGRVGSTEFEVEALQQGYQGCPDGCEFVAMGLIHPFEVTIRDFALADSGDADIKTTTRILALCYEAMGGNTCSAMPIARESIKTYMEMAPGHKVPKPEKESWKRTWKLGKRGDLELGKATGNGASKLSEPTAFKISVFDIPGHADAVQLARWPAPPSE